MLDRGRNASLIFRKQSASFFASRLLHSSWPWSTFQRLNFRMLLRCTLSHGKALPRRLMGRCARGPYPRCTLSELRRGSEHIELTRLSVSTYCVHALVYLFCLFDSGCVPRLGVHTPTKAAYGARKSIFNCSIRGPNFRASHILLS